LKVSLIGVYRFKRVFVAEYRSQALKRANTAAHLTVGARSILRRSLVRDVDVAVYFRSEEGLEGILKLASALEDKLKTPLRRLPPKLKPKVLLHGGKPVVRYNQLSWLLVSQAFSEVSDMELKYRYAVQRIWKTRALRRIQKSCKQGTSNP